MNSEKKYDPPEAVVPPALSRLMDRVARSRVYVRGEVGMSDEERKIFDYGVTERKRVLEHTLFLVFGQWALYRQVISRIKWRGARIGYGVAAFTSTTYFVAARARRVSHEMFATIATTATSSALGNEARVVLAELEGPDGPYFRQVCRDKGFSEDLTSVMAAKDAEEGMDPASDHLHPQLRLRPRLPTRPIGGGQPPLARDPRRDPRREVDFRPARVQRSRGWGAGEEDEEAPRGGVDRGRVIRRDMRRGREQEDVERIGGRAYDFRNSESGIGMTRKEKQQEDSYAEQMREKPFDFKKAADADADAAEWGVRMATDSDNAPDDPFVQETREAEMTPSQRRAEERRRKRMFARTKSGTTER